MQIYDYLKDEISRKIYLARVNFSVTGDWDYITKLPMEYRNLSADIVGFYQSLYNAKGKKVIFGAGGNGQSLVKGFKDLEFECFIDNFSENTAEEWSGLPIFRLEQYLSQYGTDYAKIIISIFNRKHCAEVAEQLISSGVDKEEIICIPSDWRNNFSQYFDVFTPHENESFVDCGCYDGGSAFRFAGWCGCFGYRKIWSFEPDKNSYDICKKALSVLDRCAVYPYGVSEHEGKVAFCGEGKEDSRIVTGSFTERVTEIQTIALDEFLKDEAVSFIKMDIEGAEYDALKGAARIITEQKPRLAISSIIKMRIFFLFHSYFLTCAKIIHFILDITVWLQMRRFCMRNNVQSMFEKRWPG